MAAGRKGGPAYDSGMRGSDQPPMPEAETEDREDSSEDMPGIVAQHVHGPDEHGHHHLNLTTLSEHMQRVKK